MTTLAGKIELSSEKLTELEKTRRAHTKRKQLFCLVVEVARPAGERKRTGPTEPNRAIRAVISYR